jgi:hypothetical protein
MINKIVCIGSSHTEGGGFHGDVETLNKIYSNIVDNPSMSTLSWPGLLESLLDEKIKVINLGKCGSGNQRLMRQFFDIICCGSFNKEETLFIFEPTHLDRREYWSNTINDYVVLNYSAYNGDMPAVLVHEYYKEETEKNQKLKDVEKLYQDFTSETSHHPIQIAEVETNYLMFYNFVKNQNINHMLLTNLVIEPNSIRNFYQGIDSIEYEIFGEKTKDIWPFVHDKELLLKWETNKLIDDWHQGYFVNNIISKTVYNNMISNNYIEGSVLEIENTEKDWYNLKEKIGTL